MGLNKCNRPPVVEVDIVVAVITILVVVVLICVYVVVVARDYSSSRGSSNSQINASLLLFFVFALVYVVLNACFLGVFYVFHAGLFFYYIVQKPTAKCSLHTGESGIRFVST